MLQAGIPDFVSEMYSVLPFKLNWRNNSSCLKTLPKFGGLPKNLCNFVHSLLKEVSPKFFWQRTFTALQNSKYTKGRFSKELLGSSSFCENTRKASFEPWCANLWAQSHHCSRLCSLGGLLHVSVTASFFAKANLPSLQGLCVKTNRPWCRKLCQLLQESSFFAKLVCSRDGFLGENEKKEGRKSRLDVLWVDPWPLRDTEWHARNDSLISDETVPDQN